VIVVPEGDRRLQFPGRLLAELLADQFDVVLPLTTLAPSDGKTRIYVGEVSSPLISSAVPTLTLGKEREAEGYFLKVDDRGAVIAGFDYRGALYGVSSFVQLVERWGRQSVAVRHATVRDWPFLPLRWVHVYIPGKENLSFARRYLRDFLLRNKFNGMILEVGGGMRLDSHPEISVGWERTVNEWYAYGETMAKIGEGIPLGTANRFAASCHFGVGGGSYLEKDDLRRFRQWAEEYGLEIVPEVQSLTHSYYLASARRDLAEDPDMAWPDSYCPSNPESYKVLFQVMDEYVEVLQPRRVHIGHDEWRAGAFCPKCKGKDTGELYAQDVLRIHQHLREKGIETWMWGDHFVDGHNRFGRRSADGGVVVYDHPDTAKARDIVAAATSEICITNWSGFADGDETFKKLGWKWIVGNFAGTEEKDWPSPVQRGGLQGGEISSWCAMDEFQLGKLHLPEAAFTINLMWSVHYPPREKALEQVAFLMPLTRSLLAAKPAPSLTATPMRFETLDIADAFNHESKGDGWDLSGLPVGKGYYNGLPFMIADPAQREGRSCVVAARRQGKTPMSIDLPVFGRWASLIFLQTATARGRETIHAGDQTHFPRESSELLGFYEIRFSDGLTLTHEIRYDETVGKWDAGLNLPLYPSRSIVAGALPDGRKAVLWASEWANPRPDTPIVSVRMVGSPGPSNALPVLFAVTAVEKPRMEDHR
jgi:hypothetical protein